MDAKDKNLQPHIKNSFDLYTFPFSIAMIVKDISVEKWHLNNKSTIDVIFSYKFDKVSAV